MNYENPFGLSIQSSLPLPGCILSEDRTDVVIQYGLVPNNLPGSVLSRAFTQVGRGRFLLVVPKVAKYLVEEGSSITIEPAIGVTEDEVRLFLMGSVWSALLLQRGMLPLHGCALQFGSGAVVFAGPSGNGKSTLAAALMAQGHTVAADELCSLTISDNAPPMLLPGFPQLLLWAHALNRLEINREPLTPVRPGLEKFILPCEEQMVKAALPVERLYILVVVNKPSFKIIPLKGMDKIQALIESTYKVNLVAGSGLNESHFKQCTQTARYIEVKRVERPGASFDIEGLVQVLKGDF